MSGCTLFNCKYYKDGVCNDPNEYVDDNGTPVCGMRNDAIPKDTTPQIHNPMSKQCRYCGNNLSELSGDEAECPSRPSSIYDVKLTGSEVLEFAEWLSENYVPTIASKELKYWQKDNYQNNDYYYFSKEILTIWLELKNIYKA